MAERKITNNPIPKNVPPEFGARPEPPCTVRVNQASLTADVLHCSEDKAQAYFHVLHPNVKRLGLRTKGAKVLPQPTRGIGNPPNTLDIKRWADSLCEHCTDEEIDYFLRLYVTVRSRCTSDFIIANS